MVRKYYNLYKEFNIVIYFIKKKTNALINYLWLKYLFNEFVNIKITLFKYQLKLFYKIFLFYFLTNYSIVVIISSLFFLLLSSYKLKLLIYQINTI